MLEVRTETLTPDYLASQQINTPDPARNCFVGQQVVVKWHIPKECFTETLTLQLAIRYGTRETEIVETPICSRFGYWTFRLLNDDYFCRCGILSYKATLFDGDTPLFERPHHIWADLIEVGE